MKKPKQNITNETGLGGVKCSLWAIAEARRKRLKEASMKAKSKRKKLKTAYDAYHIGWCMRGNGKHVFERQQFYLSMLNDLAEGIEIPAKITKENLAEALGWSQRQNEELFNYLREINGEMLVLAAKAIQMPMVPMSAKRDIVKRAKRRRAGSFHGATVLPLDEPPGTVYH